MENNLNIHTGPRAIKFFLDKHVNKKLDEIGITSSYAPFILTIDEEPGSSLKDISYLMSVDKALVTRMVKHLIEEGFAVNTSEDPRKYRMELTDKGKEASVVIKESLNETWELLLKDLTQEEKENFRSTLTKIKMTIRNCNSENEQ